MYRKAALILALFWFILAATVHATGKRVPAVLHRDTSYVAVKKLNAAALKNYAADREFNYNDAETADLSLWNRFWNWFWHWIGSLFSNAPGVSKSVGYLLVTAAAAGILYIILKSTGLLTPKGKSAPLPFTESLENIHEIDFDSEIEKAISQHNYRLAVRLLYLKCLKQLSDAGLIQWQIDKTNSAYLYELTDQVQRETFGSLTRRFEYVWYGGFGIDERSFNEINLLFQQFKKQLP